MEKMECTSLNNLHVKKGYVQRDYSRGTKIRFETTLPGELESYISRQEFAQFVETLNDIYLEAEKLNFCEGCLACLTAYLLYCCIETNRIKYMKKAADFIANQNELWRDRGIMVMDPMTRGFRILEIQVNTSSHQNKDPGIS